jgi:hypothetical protein
MKTHSLLAVGLIIAVASTMSSAAPPASAPRITEVYVLDVGQNLPKFIELSKRIDALVKKYGSQGTSHYWIGQWAGSDVGKVIVTVEFPSLMALAQDEEKFQNNPEFQQWQADAAASGVKLLSQSIVTELKR